MIKWKYLNNFNVFMNLIITYDLTQIFHLVYDIHSKIF